jgi:hypothetical protein
MFAYDNAIVGGERAPSERLVDLAETGLLMGNRDSTFYMTMGRPGIEPGTLGLRGPCSAG